MYVGGGKFTVPLSNAECFAFNYCLYLSPGCYWTNRPLNYRLEVVIIFLRDSILYALFPGYCPGAVGNDGLLVTKLRSHSTNSTIMQSKDRSKRFGHSRNICVKPQEGKGSVGRGDPARTARLVWGVSVTIFHYYCTAPWWVSSLPV